jgi:hypothetical protein
MSSFLWVEDFSSGDQGGFYSEFASAVFGKSLGILPEGFPNFESGLRQYLDQRKIFLITTYADARRFIDKRLAEVDAIILDIDLQLMGEDDDIDRPLIIPELKKWYNYDPDAEDEETSFSQAKREMIRVAGYHLFVHLVMKRGFPYNRILFCSNHGNYLNAIKKSFGEARIDLPNILSKADSKAIDEWVRDQREDPYIYLRRWLIDSCGEISRRLDACQTEFLLPHLLGSEVNAIPGENAKVLLQTIPMLLPRDGSRETDRFAAFRIIVRTLTQDFDKVNYKALEGHQRAFACVLKLARNWTSHDTSALSALSEGDISFLFLITMRVCFRLEENRLEKFELGLLKLFGPRTDLDEGVLKTVYELSYARIRTRCDDGKIDSTSFFDDMVDKLQREGLLSVNTQSNMLMQVFWHQMCPRRRDGTFTPRVNRFSRIEFVNELSRHLFSISFKK